MVVPPEIEGRALGLRATVEHHNRAHHEFERLQARAMGAAVHIADFGFPGAFRALVAAPKPAKVPGLRSAKSGLGAELGGLVLPIPSLKRVVMVSFWDDDASIDAFEASHPAAARFVDGWSVRLEPLRAFGTWPGLDTDVAHSRSAV